MSSLIDDLNARAYGSAGSSGVRTCHCDTCDAPAEPACDLCGADGVPLVWDDMSSEHLCATCAPREGETCEGYIARCREIRKAPRPCACTAPFSAPGAYAAGTCRAHGFAWHTRGSR